MQEWVLKFRFINWLLRSLELRYIVVVVYFMSTSGFARTLIRTETKIRFQNKATINVVVRNKVVEVVEKIGAFKRTFKVDYDGGDYFFKNQLQAPCGGIHCLNLDLDFATDWV